MCQTVWSQVRLDILSGLICVQTVCEGCQQRTLAGKEFKLIYKKSKVTIVPLSNGQINCEIYLPVFSMSVLDLTGVIIIPIYNT